MTGVGEVFLVVIVDLMVVVVVVAVVVVDVDVVVGVGVDVTVVGLVVGRKVVLELAGTKDCAVLTTLSSSTGSSNLGSVNGTITGGSLVEVI